MAVSVPGSYPSGVLSNRWPPRTGVNSSEIRTANAPSVDQLRRLAMVPRDGFEVERGHQPC